MDRDRETETEWVTCRQRWKQKKKKKNNDYKSGNDIDKWFLTNARASFYIVQSFQLAANLRIIIKKGEQKNKLKVSLSTAVIKISRALLF
jgi:hypothetical protein